MNEMKNKMLRQLLLSNSPLLMSADAFVSAALSCFPISDGESKQTDYNALTQDALASLNDSKEDDDICVTADYGSEELPINSISYHRIFGTIHSRSRWFFSSMQFVEDIKTADDNESISAHFLHISSGGGEAWYLDRVAETLQSLRKPVFAFVEKSCASAAYYIASQCQVIYALTKNDSIGCIGTMISFWDLEPYFEKMGLKHILVKAEKSDLKNKKYEDLLHGKPKQFIDEDLNPINEQFLEAVRMRSALSSLDDDNPILHGETYQSSVAQENGLIDGICTFEAAIIKAHQMGLDYRRQQETNQRTLSFV